MPNRFAAVSGHRSVEPQTAVILGSIWRIMTSPDEIENGADCQLDHIDRILWLSPSLPNARRPYVIEDALERAASEALVMLQSTEQTM